MRPQIAHATRELIEKAGHAVYIPKNQSCCGQPAYNSGYIADAAPLLDQTAQAFADCDEVVIPSGSCCSIFRHHAKNMLPFIPEARRAAVSAFSEKTFEASQWLERHEYRPSPVDLEGKTVTYHDGCAGLRELGIEAGPRRLLAQAGIDLIPMNNAQQCCGFGGRFATKFGELSSAIVAQKCESIEQCDADIVALGDLGCALNIEGKLAYRFESGESSKKIDVRHFTELLTHR